MSLEDLYRNGVELNVAKSLRIAPGPPTEFALRGRVGIYLKANESLEEQRETFFNNNLADPQEKRIFVSGVGENREDEPLFRTSLSDPWDWRRWLGTTTFWGGYEPQRRNRILRREEIDNYSPQTRALRSERWKRWVLNNAFYEAIARIAPPNRTRDQMWAVWVELYAWYSSYDYGELPLTVEEIEESEFEKRPIFAYEGPRGEDANWEKHKAQWKTHLELKDIWEREALQTFERYYEKIKQPGWANDFAAERARLLFGARRNSAKQSIRAVVHELLPEAMPWRNDYLDDLRIAVRADIETMLAANAEILGLEGEIRQGGNAKRLADLRTRLEAERAKRPTALQKLAGLRAGEPRIEAPREADRFLEVKEGEEVAFDAFLSDLRTAWPGAGITVAWRWRIDGEVREGGPTFKKRAERDFEAYVEVVGTIPGPHVVFRGTSACAIVSVKSLCKRCDAYFLASAPGTCEWSWPLAPVAAQRGSEVDRKELEKKLERAERRLDRATRLYDRSKEHTLERERQFKEMEEAADERGELRMHLQELGDPEMPRSATDDERASLNLRLAAEGLPPWAGTRRITSAYEGARDLILPDAKSGLSRGSEKWRDVHSSSSFLPRLPRMKPYDEGGTLERGSVRVAFEGEVERLEIEWETSEDKKNLFDKILGFYLQ